MVWDRDSWKKFAACRDVPDPNIFFADEEGIYRHEAEAKEICRNCPVRKACRRLANQGTGEKGGWPGIYAGTTHAQRRREEGGRRSYKGKDKVGKKPKPSTDLLPWPIPDIVAS